MRIQHNMTAANTNRMLGITNNNVAKSAEKLSSGYKINRAADNAAGLKISEKLRSADKWEEAYAAMTEDERLDILDKLSPDVLQFQPEHLVSFLWNNQSKTNLRD